MRTAHDDKCDKLVAIKIFDKRNNIKAAYVEKGVMTWLDHANIMKINDYFEDKDKCYLVMDLMVDDMRNAANLSYGAFTEEYAKKIFYEMLKAVNHCHEKGIVHRDIKLENFLVDFDERTSDIIIKLSDFGLSEFI